MAWSNQTGSLVNQIQSYLTSITDDHIRTQTAAWVRAWDDLAPELEDALNELSLQAVDGRVSRRQVMRSVRLQRAIAQIQARLGVLVDDSSAAIIDRLADTVDHAGAMQERLIRSTLPIADQDVVRAWTRVDAGAVDAIITRTTEQITKLTYPLAPDAAQVMRSELVRGIAVGENPRAVASRMVSRTESTFNGGLSRALTIARTEMLDAHRAAAQLSDDENADTLAGWVWTCSLSNRTCPACLSMHGQVFPLAQSGPNGHQNCRCARVPKAKTWRELGFDIDEPADLTPNADDYFAGLTEDEQRNLLGPSRFEAWKAGNYPREQWATRQDNPGWRESYVTTPAPKVAA